VKKMDHREAHERVTAVGLASGSCSMTQGSSVEDDGGLPRNHPSPPTQPCLGQGKGVCVSRCMRRWRSRLSSRTVALDAMDCRSPGGSEDLPLQECRQVRVVTGGSFGKYDDNRGGG
jgi:hypothetical protein